MPRNPSELERLEQELAHYKKQVRTCPTKSGKETMLKFVRAIERELGIEGQPYNNSKGI